MKLLIYSHYFAPSIGGVETITHSLASGVARLRSAGGEPEFEVTFATQTAGKGFDDRSLPFRIIRKPSLFQLWRLVRNCDAVHVAGPSLAPLLLGWTLRKPVIVEHHSYQAICPKGNLVHEPDGAVCPGHFLAHRYGECLRCLECESSRLRSWKNLLFMFARNFLTKRAAANLAISRYILKRFEFPRSSVIYHGIDDPLQDLPEPTVSELASGRFRFAYVGRFVPEKGLPILLEATRLLRDEGQVLEVLLVGDGPQRPELEALIHRYQLQEYVRITGFLTGKALNQVVEGIRVVVMPSICEETAGLAAIEQMMRGRLVIASDIGGLGEVVGDAGLKCAPGDARVLAETMRRVIQQPSVANSLGKAARARALGLFRRERMLVEHARVYRDLVARARS